MTDRELDFGSSVVADDEFDDNIHIRTTEEDPPLYAVFDDIEQVSKRYTVREYGNARSFAKGYQAAKEKQ